VRPEILLSMTHWLEMRDRTKGFSVCRKPLVDVYCESALRNHEGGKKNLPLSAILYLGIRSFMFTIPEHPFISLITESEIA
jgi:hypothetical protein